MKWGSRIDFPGSKTFRLACAPVSRRGGSRVFHGLKRAIEIARAESGRSFAALSMMRRTGFSDSGHRSSILLFGDPVCTPLYFRRCRSNVDADEIDRRLTTPLLSKKRSKKERTRRPLFLVRVASLVCTVGVIGPSHFAGAGCAPARPALYGLDASFSLLQRTRSCAIGDEALSH